MADVPKLCKNCICYDAKTQECHRYAPRPVDLDQQKKVRWPAVQPINWCLEFQPKQ
ncbi:MAG: hypothetical protein JXA82_11645 [Sedimentisphaerales bacterium]|nr:hypothetical protein [Sedimentisphaerales bacterium]